MKTFWAVELAVWGATCGTVNYWFDNYKDAKDFAKQNFTGKPVRHTYSAKRSIEKAERNCMCSREDMEVWQ